jgi:phosphopantothenoylcysteine decarboxylase
MPNILLAVTGSVAAKLTPKIQEQIQTKHKLRTIVSKSAEFFIPASPHDILTEEDEQRFQDTEKFMAPYDFYREEDEWKWQNKGDQILHIEIGLWADLILVAPLTANTLSKIAAGNADNLITNTIRAWNYQKPMLLCPVMNTQMWESPFTSKHLEIMKSLGATVMEPVEKTLMCGVHGKGALPPIESILQKMETLLNP